METERIDQLLRSMSLRATRRGVVTGLTGGFVAMLPLALRRDATEAKTKNKKKGKRKTKSQHKPQDGPSQPPTSNPTPLPPPVNPCAGQPDFTDCGNGMECSGGVCAVHPQCRVGLCYGLPLTCCSGIICQNNCPAVQPRADVRVV